MGLLKIALLGLSFKSGFLGGPTFPAIFAATMVALAISSLVPTVPLALLITGIEVSLVTLIFRAPFASILLVVVISSANTILFGLICISAATGLLASIALEQLTARRAAQ
jgi:hypothetical protein